MTVLAIIFYLTYDVDFEDEYKATKLLTKETTSLAMMTSINHCYDKHNLYRVKLHPLKSKVASSLSVARKYVVVDDVSKFRR
jgi:hypothetical protein